MNSRKNPQRRTRSRKRALSRVRLTIFLLLFVFCTVAVSLGGLIPSDQLRAFAQLRRGSIINANLPGGKGQGAEQLSASVRQQIAALMQEKATRSAGRRKMDSRLIYGIKMERGEQIADA